MHVREADFATELAAQRDRLGLDDSQLARWIAETCKGDYANLSRVTVNRWLQGHNAPDYEVQGHIIQVLATSSRKDGPFAPRGHYYRGHVAVMGPCRRSGCDGTVFVRSQMSLDPRAAYSSAGFIGPRCSVCETPHRVSWKRASSGRPDAAEVKLYRG